MTDWNAQIIEEFRANDGKVTGPFEGGTLLILHSTGAKSGKERINPLMYQKVDEGYAVFASKAGAPTNPDWYYNLKANPEAWIEVGTDRVDVTAHEVVGNARDEIFDRQKQAWPGFAEYEQRAGRTIPVMILEPR